MIIETVSLKVKRRPRATTLFVVDWLRRSIVYTRGIVHWSRLNVIDRS
jgi:hypothetical protein